MNDLKISIIGASGRMGSTIIEESKNFKDIIIKHLIEHKGHKIIGSTIDGLRVTDDLEGCIEESDVLIDFSSPISTLNIMKKLSNKDSPALVIGTTGFSVDQEKEFDELRNGLKVLRASNMSVGVNIMFNITHYLTKILPDETNIEILDVHHKSKKDAPSGTSLSLGEEVKDGKSLEKNFRFEFRGSTQNSQRKENEIGFSSIRGGDVIGDHSVFFFLDGERIEIIHRASSRNIYAKGALAAARWINNKKQGLYNMKDLVKVKQGEENVDSQE